MTGFEPRTSGIGNDHSTNWATPLPNRQRLFRARLKFFPLPYRPDRLRQWDLLERCSGVGPEPTLPTDPAATFADREQSSDPQLQYKRLQAQPAGKDRAFKVPNGEPVNWETRPVPPLRPLVSQPLSPVKAICMIVMSLAKEKGICSHTSHLKSKMERQLHRSLCNVTTPPCPIHGVWGGSRMTSCVAVPTKKQIPAYLIMIKDTLKTNYWVMA